MEDNGKIFFFISFHFTRITSSRVHTLLHRQINRDIFAAVDIFEVLVRQLETSLPRREEPLGVIRLLNLLQALQILLTIAGVDILVRRSIV